MITHLSVKDFAIIESIEIDIHPGLNIITGETGAGKSIIIEAINQALGSRADSALVRKGCEKAKIQLAFDEGPLPEDKRAGIEVLTRDISRTGKSVCKLNGEIVTLGQLSATTAKAVDIHGQYDHQSLLNPDNHLGLIDAYHAAEILPVREKTAYYYSVYRDVNNKYKGLIESESASKRELDFLRFEVKEIEGAHIRDGEYEELRETASILQNSEKIYEALSLAHEEIDGDPSALESIGHAMHSLSGIAAFSESYQTLSNSVSEAYYTLEEAASELRDKKDGMDFSEKKLSDILSRLDQLDRLISKYGGSKGDLSPVMEYLDDAAKRLEDIENFDDKKRELAKQMAGSEEELARCSRELSALRREAAKELEDRINEQLRDLNFKDAKFHIQFDIDGVNAGGLINETNITSTEPDETSGQNRAIDPSRYSASGIDSPEFLLSANKGQPLLPLVKVASGGELSRIMLAFKSVTGAFDNIPTMVFDEIDSGISGITATIIGEKLKEMAEFHQIICITHLPQIAAFADHHFVIEKDSDDETTYTTINEIHEDERIREIARLLGGRNVTDTTIENAKELIELSGQSE